MYRTRTQRYDACTALLLQRRFAYGIHQSGVAPMRLLSLALAASFALAGYAQAQTPAASESQPAPSSSSGHPLSKSCRSEVAKLCGSTHGEKMHSCVKDNLGQNKFSADCTTELKAHVPPPKPAS